ncbi:hypothetical protein AB9F41_33825, partial [Rhizobium leguminosarum]
VFINLLCALRAFDIIYILTGGGPVLSTETVGYFMYRESMTQFKLGYCASATVILLLAVLIVSIPAVFIVTHMDWDSGYLSKTRCHASKVRSKRSKC